MKNRVILTFNNGRKLDAVLAHPLMPHENTIDVLLDADGQLRGFPLNDLCCIAVLGKPVPTTEQASGECLEEVETVTGERYLVNVKTSQQLPNGFYCTPADENQPYKSLFFTSHGIKIRKRSLPEGGVPDDVDLLPEDDLQVIEEEKSEQERSWGENLLAKASTLHQEIVDSFLPKRVTITPHQHNSRVGDILVAADLVTREQVEKTLEGQTKKKIGTLLIERGLISEDQLLTALATKFQMQFVDLQTVSPSPDALKALSRMMVNQMQVLPLEVKGKKLVVATSEPTNSTIIDRLRFTTNRNIELVVALSSQISAAIEKYYNLPIDAVDTLISELDGAQATVVEQTEETMFIEPDSKVIQLVNKLLIDAYNKGASDIHFEPPIENNPFVVRYRVDGECFIAHQVPYTYKSAIISRLKIVAKLDIAERRKPQSGKIFLLYERRKLEYRLEITPTVGGQEDAVLRLLTASKPLSLHAMGFSPPNLARFEEILSKPYGIILCAGPTGSGKTTTLHSALATINTPERKIWTAEDPVEIIQRGLRQVQVNPKIGYSFQEALRSFLRADPDVIMIGEMRDAETAKTAIAASLTGHLVFSTLHTNSAPETAVRLIEMGMDPFNFADALLGILAQRLARRLCDQCRESYHPSREEYDEIVCQYGPEWFKEHGLPSFSGNLKLMKKSGCEKCGGTGYKGRISIHELLIGSPAIKSAVKTNASAETLRDLAMHEGMCTLKMDGIQKVFQGITDLDQITKVCLL